MENSKEQWQKLQSRFYGQNSILISYFICYTYLFFWMFWCISLLVLLMLKNKICMTAILFSCNVFLQCLCVKIKHICVKMYQGRQNIKWNLFNRCKSIHQRTTLKIRKIDFKFFILKSSVIICYYTIYSIVYE